MTVDYSHPTIRRAFDGLIGDRLTSVTFIFDYAQLHFDEHGFTVNSSMSIVTPTSMTKSDEPGFKDLLCNQFGKAVDAYELEQDFFSIGLGDCSIRVSLKDADFKGPEAAEFFSKHASVIFRGSDVCVFDHSKSISPLPPDLALIASMRAPQR